MFETSPWTASNRRHFAIVERAYELVDRPLETERWELGDDAMFAATLVHNVGTVLLGQSIWAACTGPNGKHSKRKDRDAWRRIEPDAGVRASVFLTLASAAMFSKDVAEERIDQVPIDFARFTVEGAYAPSEEDQELVEAIRKKAVDDLLSPETSFAREQGGLRPDFIRSYAETKFSYNALEMAGAEPAAMPAFAPVAQVEQSEWGEVYLFDWNLTATVRFPTVWKSGLEPFIDIALTRLYR